MLCAQRTQSLVSKGDVGAHDCAVDGADAVEEVNIIEVCCCSPG